MKYEPVIGLEIHTELKTKTKMFCASKNEPDEKHPNFNICPVCTGQPGTLPTINEEAVKKTIKVGMALESKIADETRWDRKNYFYPDLPKGYQISQYDKPLCFGGELTIPGGRKIRVRRIHLEEDTGRLLHESHVGHSLVDFNRAGVPLMELVTEPDLRSGQEASAFAQELQLILRYLGVSDADMEKGQLRVEANISLRPENPNSKTQIPNLGTKVEIKNLNSFKAVRDAVDYEIKRQAELLEDGKKIVQETRGWSGTKGETFSQRSKEESHDYRYFPEPDLPSLKIDPVFIQDVAKALPELPAQKRERFARQYGLGAAQINTLVADEKLAEFFENVVSEFMDWESSGLDKDSRLAEGFDVAPHAVVDKQKLFDLAANYTLSDLLGLLNKASASVDDIRIKPEDFAEWLGLIHRGVITSRAAKDVLYEMWATGKDPSLVVKEKNLVQIQDAGEIEKTAREVVSRNAAAVSDYKKGKLEALKFLVGEAMKETRGKANPQLLKEIFEKLLK